MTPFETQAREIIVQACTDAIVGATPPGEYPFNVAIIDQALTALTQLHESEVRKAQEAKDNAYWERDQLVAYLARQHDSHLVRHPDSDKDWEDDWRWIVCIHTPAGQMTWHIHDKERDSTFAFLPVNRPTNHWDGHTTEEKYDRLSSLTPQSKEKIK